MTTQQVVVNLLASPEYQQKLVNDLYIQYLGRPADPDGLASHVAMLQSSGEQAVIISLLSSDEFYANAGGTNEGFLSALYLALLDRPIDSTGLANYLAELNFGVSRATVVAEILNSAEGLQAQVNQAYQTYLDRTGDPSGLQSWVGVLANTPNLFLVDFLSTPEFSDRLMNPTTPGKSTTTG